ncbi:transglycosylase SLT domain-containing protein [Paraburkholderia kururiensis]|uniref:lytic transglycosylase domain-containing protein n=1 Tax=Paraburkholderia kururiensis TaxID=984307 RepID=UPI000347A530|nr:transglycosylase SLT domain-containing protein [Paraburkholderia kururiensis]
MPTIPLQTSQTVMPSGPATPYQNIPSSPADFGAAVGQGLQGVAAQIGRGADDLANAQLAYQGLQNETMAKEADIKATQALADLEYNPQSGYYAKMGKDAVDGYQGAMDSAMKIREDARNTLPNPQAQKMFDDVFVRRMQYSLTSMAQHAAQQNKMWQVGTSEARANLSLNYAANYYNDDQQFKTALATANTEAVQQGEIMGWSTAQIAQKQADYTSKAWTQRIMRVAQNDPLAAQSMYSDNQAFIGANEKPQLEHFLKSNVMPVVARNIVSSVIGGQPTVNGQTLPDLHAAVESAESQGSDAAVSPKGAKGKMQVMDATNWNPGFGVQPAQDDSPQERTRVGNDYLDAMIARYHGDQTLALAAYNWGPGKVDALLQKSPAATGQQLFGQLPAETQAYIERINAKVPPQGGTPATSPDPRTHLADWQGQVSQLATALYPNDPTFRDMAVGNLFNEVNKVVAGQEGLQKGARDQLVSAAMGAAGGQKPTTLDQLLSNPDAKNAWAMIQPEQQLGIMNLIEHNAKGTEPQMTPEALSTYYRLRGEAATNPMAFQQEDLSKTFGVLPYHLTLDLIGQQARSDGRQAADQQKAENLQHALAVAKPMLGAAGVHIPAPKDPQDKWQDFNQFAGRMSKALDDFYSQNKKPPTDKDVRSITNSLLTQGAQSGTAGWLPWSHDEQVMAFQTDASNFYVPVPATEKPKIAAAYQKAFGHPPSEADMQAFYTRYTLANARNP